jgi:hypothetical protein
MEEPSPGGRCSEIASDIFVALLTVAQLIFFASFHEYIAWYTTAPDGSVTRQSLLTDDYFAWLPFPTVASINMSYEEAAAVPVRGADRFVQDRGSDFPKRTHRGGAGRGRNRPALSAGTDGRGPPLRRRRG